MAALLIGEALAVHYDHQYTGIFQTQIAQRRSLETSSREPARVLVFVRTPMTEHPMAIPEWHSECLQPAHKSCKLMQRPTLPRINVMERALKLPSLRLWGSPLPWPDQPPPCARRRILGHRAQPSPAQGPLERDAA